MSRTSKKNMETYRNKVRNHYNLVYGNIARSMFIWKGLPEGIPEEYMEKQLYDVGSVMFAEDAMVGYFLTRYGAAGQVDMYDRQTHFNVVSTSGLNGKRYSIDDVVIVKNNKNLAATSHLIKKNIDELVEIAVTKQTNQSLQRMPTVILTDDKTKQSLVSVLLAGQNGDGPVVAGLKGFSIDKIDIIENRQEYLGAELREEERMIIGELLTMLGINNLEISKKERLVAAEAEVNEDEVGINLVSFLQPREEAAEEINRRFGLNVSVELNPLLTKVDEPEGPQGLASQTDDDEGDVE